MRTDSMRDAGSLKMEKETFMKSKLPWGSTVTKPDSQLIATLNDKIRRALKDGQKMIEETGQTAIGGGKASSSGDGRKTRRRAIARGMSGGRPKNSPENGTRRGHMNHE